MALKWNPFNYAKTFLLSTSQTKISMNLDLPFIAIYPVTAILQVGCKSKLIISSSCSLKNFY